MPVIEEIKAYAEEFGQIRRNIHAHPETAYEEIRTAEIVAEQLRSFG